MSNVIDNSENNREIDLNFIRQTTKNQHLPNLQKCVWRSTCRLREMGRLW